MRNAFVSMVLLMSACGQGPGPEPMPEPDCAGVSLSAITLSAGGRAEVPLAPSLVSVLTEVSATGVEAWREGDHLIVRGGYDAAAGTVSLACTTGSITMPVTVQPLSMTPLVSWDAATAGAPAAREYFAWWLGTDRAVYLYGGFVYQPVQFTPSTDLFRFDLSSNLWSQVEWTGDAPVAGGRVASDGERFLYFGGGIPMADGALDTPPTLVSIATDAESARFENQPAAGMPGSYTGAFVRDAARDRWLSVCGADSRALGVHCRVHAYTEGTGFVELPIDGEPPAGRYGFHYAMDLAHDRVIVFGGLGGGTAVLGDTWALELAPEDGAGPRWTRLFEASEGISERRNGAYAYDPESQRFFVWGGTADGRTAVPGLEVLELDRGRESWTHVALPAEVPPRASGGGVLDPEGHRILWGFGNESRLYTDLYVLALAPTTGI